MILSNIFKIGYNTLSFDAGMPEWPNGTVRLVLGAK